MIKILKESYLFIIFFILLLLKNPLYKLFTIKDNIYTPLKCSITEQEFNKLLEFNEIDLIYDSEYLNTYIIYKDIYNYLDEITIRGGKDKNLKNFPVVYDNTLIGIISKVEKTSSIVKLLTNPNIKVSVKINDTIGVLENNNDELIVSNITNYSDINIGDYVYTSGLGNIKENIFIGEVKNITINNKDIEKRVVVDYKINIKDIDYVTIIKEQK